jgi:hypothetical protein
MTIKRQACLEVLEGEFKTEVDFDDKEGRPLGVSVNHEPEVWLEVKEVEALRDFLNTYFPQGGAA